MSTPMPADQIANEISSLQSRLNWLQDEVRLKDSLNAVSDLQTATGSLPQVISTLRVKGYAFEKSLESQATNFSTQWGALSPALANRINTESTRLLASLQSIEYKLSQLTAVSTNPNAALPLLSVIQNDIQILENDANSAKSTVQGMYSAFNNDFMVFKRHLGEIDFMLGQLAEAKFSLLSTEGGLRAAKATWYREGKKRDDDPSGIFYLTDQRILFEQKEEVATKKVLFITTAKQKVQELKWETPVALIETVTPSKQGMLKNEDHLDLTFKAGAPYESIHLHIWQDGSEWLQFINRARTRDFDSDRAVPIDQNKVDELKNIPTKCPSCGANITQTVLRGQDNLACEYCGYLILYNF